MKYLSNAKNVKRRKLRPAILAALLVGCSAVTRPAFSDDCQVTYDPTDKTIHIPIVNVEQDQYEVRMKQEETGECRSMFAVTEVSPVFASVSSELFRVRLFFGLSISSGGGVSLNEWNEFQTQEIATVFDGFNVVDSVGYYEGKPERSKIVTLIIKEEEMEKVRTVAQLYAQRFEQDSVMLVVVPVLEWDFIGAE